ncbi:MAG TPA: 16S rRNA (uracil(1498)-N(3))-methyltransferase [Burkholderiaceae bacterium]|nr:16S rRNA (uracil(1498)-N(3))-methyltransferase [Burkholderiaceae bacterium]
MPRFYCPVVLVPGEPLELPAGAARHVQVLRKQPGDAITLFNGNAGEFEATVTQMGRSTVLVQVGAHHAVEREAARAVHLALGIPANERMDWLVEKATELGVASIRPLFAERSVLKLKGDRADKKHAHWQAIAVAACEQCGRNRLPLIHEPVGLAEWLAAAPMQPAASRFVLSLRAPQQRLSEAASGQDEVTFLSGPEGGLSSAEEDAAIASGFAAINLGPRVLRAETAPLAVLAALTLAV